MQENYKTPVYTIGIASNLLNVCPATLRIWEKKGLIRPSRIGKNRFYSRCDIDKLSHVKELLHKKGLNIEGVKHIVRTTKCWEIKKCNKKERETCSVYLEYGNA